MQTYGFGNRCGEKGFKVTRACFLVNIVDSIFQGFDRMLADKMADIMQQCGDHEAVRGAIGNGTGRALFHMLRHRDCLAHVFLGPAVGEQIQDEVDNLVRLLVPGSQCLALQTSSLAANSESRTGRSKSILRRFLSHRGSLH